MTAIYNNMTEYKIYKIKSPHTDTIYIGSTSKTLEKRLSGHIYNYKAWLKDNTTDYITSFEILKFNEYVIELIESCICIDKLERNEKEGYHIKLNKLICVNKKIEGRSRNEFYQDNKEEIKQYRYNRKKETKQYYQDNKEKLKQYRTEYSDTHKEQIKEQGIKKQTCEICNGKYTHQNKARHNKTIKHLEKLNQASCDISITYDKEIGHIKKLS